MSIVDQLERFAQQWNAASLDAPAGDAEDSRTLADTCGVAVEPVAFAQLDMEQRRAILARGLDLLPLRDRLVLVARHGLDGAEEASQDDVAAVFGLTRQGVSAAERRARAALRRFVASGGKPAQPGNV